MRTFASLLLLSLIAFVTSTGCATNNLRVADKKIVLIAGKPSHGPGEHEHRAGVLLFQKCLADFPGVNVEVYTNGWPTDSAILNGAAAVVIYSDGGGGHPALQEDHLQQLDALVKHGVGFGCIHYAVEPTQEKGQKEFLDWIGGCFEIHRSVNPTWEADYKTLPYHPIARGVTPFKIKDEWYFNMRFREGMKGVTSILSAIPDADTMYRADGPHEGNPAVRAAVARGDAQTMMWASERADGARGFGFTGGHYHRNWGNDNFRKLVLNAILWSAKVEVPTDGVKSTVTADDLEQNLDPKGRKPKAKTDVAPAPAVK
jgi:type 1 glutamine amidotransferase